MTAQTVSALSDGRSRACANASNPVALGSTIVSYGRNSCESQTRKGLHEVNAAATTPARLVTSLVVAKYITGTVTTPASAGSERSANSPKPNTRAQTHATQ